MSSRARVSFLKHQVSEVYKSSGSAWTGYLFALALEGILFVVSRGLKSESEILFALIYVISAILIAIFLGQGPGIFAGILAVICVDYHYIGPLGKGLNTIEGFVFLILTLGVVQLALVGVWLLQNTARDTEEARAKLEEAVRSREEILAVVAHDLRQPLAAFTLRQDLALRNLKTGQIENVMRLLQDGQRSLHQMDQLIEDLLDGSRVDAGNVSLSLEKIDLEELARNSYDAFYLQAVNKQILFRFIASFEKLPDLLIDSHRVGRVLSNLLSNALKFTPEHGEIEVSLHLIESRYVELRIKDSGVGIKADKIENIFQKHWQEKSTAHLGTGLGLYICQGIIAAHKGSIWYEPSPHFGSTFCIRLPVPDIEDQPALTLARDHTYCEI